MRSNIYIVSVQVSKSQGEGLDATLDLHLWKLNQVTRLQAKRQKVSKRDQKVFTMTLHSQTADRVISKMQTNSISWREYKRPIDALKGGQ